MRIIGNRTGYKKIMTMCQSPSLRDGAKISKLRRKCHLALDLPTESNKQCLNVGMARILTPPTLEPLLRDWRPKTELARSHEPRASRCEPRGASLKKPRSRASPPKKPRAVNGSASALAPGIHYSFRELFVRSKLVRAKCSPRKGRR